jgi:hypothetical protein
MEHRGSRAAERRCLGAAINIMPWEITCITAILTCSNNYEGVKGYIHYMLTWTDDNGIVFSQAPENKIRTSG